MVQCRKCNRTIVSYPCPSCGEEGREFLGKEGTTGGGTPG